VKGSVYKRPHGRWEYRFDIDPDPLTGRRRFASMGGFSTEREAARAMRTAMAAHEKGRHVRASSRTVQQFLDEWHAAVQPGLRATTWVNYRDYLDAYVIPIIGNTRLRDLTPVRLNLLYSHLLTKGRVRSEGGLAPKTVQNVHRLLHRALRDAVKWDYLARNVAEDAEPPRVRRRKPQVWTPDQLRAFVHHVREDRFYALWLLVVTTGLRRGELAGLTRRDIDLASGRVSPTTTRVVVDGHAAESDPKTTSGERTLALDPVTRAALETYIATWAEERRLLGQAHELLFVWPDGKALHPDTITALFHRHVAAAGLPRIRLHDVRHSYATAALKAGVPAKVVSERLGHATAAFTLQVYSHVIPGMDEHAAATVADLILGTGDSAAQIDAHKSAHTTQETPLETN
jgi:integrase